MAKYTVNIQCILFSQHIWDPLIGRSAYDAKTFNILTTNTACLLTSSEGTATCARSGSGMWDGSAFPATGTTLPGSGGHRHQ